MLQRVKAASGVHPTDPEVALGILCEVSSDRIAASHALTVEDSAGSLFGLTFGGRGEHLGD